MAQSTCHPRDSRQGNWGRADPLTTGLTVVEASVPPFGMPLQASAGMWVGEGPAAKLCVQTRHHPPEFRAGRLWKRTQRLLQDVPGVRHVDKRGLRMGRGWKAQVQVAARLSQERPVMPERGLHRPVPQAVPQSGPGIAVLTLRALDLGAGALGQPGDSAGPRAPDGRDRSIGAKRARPSTRHGPFGWSSCSRSCRAACQPARARGPRARGDSHTRPLRTPRT